MPYAHPSSPTSLSTSSSSTLSSPLAGRSRRSSGASIIGEGHISPILRISALPSTKPILSPPSTKGFGLQTPQSPTRSRSASSSSSVTIGGDEGTLKPRGTTRFVNNAEASSSSSRTPSPSSSHFDPELAHHRPTIAGLTHRNETTNGDAAHQPSLHSMTLVNSHASPSSVDDAPGKNVAAWAEQAALQLNALVKSGHDIPKIEEDSLTSGAESGTSSNSESSSSSTTTSPRRPSLSFAASETVSTPETSAETTPTGSIMFPKPAEPSTTHHLNAMASSSSYSPRQQNPSAESSGTSTPHRIRSPPSSRTHSRASSPIISRHHPASFASSSAAAGFFVVPGTPGSEHNEVGDGVGVGMGGRGALPGLPRRSSSAVGGLNRMARVEGLPTSAGSWTGSHSSGSSSPAIPASPFKDGSLGIRLGPSTRNSQSRENRESISSSSTLESSGPQTPVDAEELVNGLKTIEMKHHQHMHAHGHPGLSKHTSHVHHGSTRHSVPSSGQLTPTNSGSESERTVVHQSARKEQNEESNPITPDSTEISGIPFPSLSSSPENNSDPPGSPPTPASLAHIFSDSPRAPVVNPRHPPRSGVGLRRQPSSSLQLDIPSSSVAHSHWHSHPHEHANHIYRPSSIRKKSGEIVKPSLKQRSLSTPHLPIRNDYGSTKSEPATPSVEGSEFSERAKNVRFAGQDDDKSQLEYVRHFQRGSKVTAVSREGDADGAYTETETENDTDASYVSFRTSRNAAAAALDDAEKVIFTAFSTSLPRVRLDFTPNQTEGDKAALAHETVVLERLDLPTEGPSLVLRGSVLVRNVAFQKWVAVRFTLDHWQTVSEVSATHVTHIATLTPGDNEGWDRFSFNIKLDDMKRNIQDKELLLCVRYSVEGREWWDSNNGNNYRFGFKKIRPVRPSRMSGIARRQIDAEDLLDLPLNRPTPGMQPLVGSRAPNFGRTPSWMNSGSPRGSPSVLPPSRPALHRADTPRNSSPPRQPVFGQPHAPDVHDHLKLTGTYCAPPPPPASPGKETLPSPPRGRQLALSDVVGGQFATADPSSFEKGHARRRSWNGDMGDMSYDWEETAEDPELDSPNTLTGVYDGAGQAGAHNTPSQAKNGLSMAPKGGPAGVMDLFTPPRSLSPSPPRPQLVIPESPSTATTSPSIVGNTPSDDFATLPSVITDANDPDRETASTLQNASYQELIAKYCFFQSNASEVPTAAIPRQPVRPVYSGLSSPASPASLWGSDRLTPTGGRGFNTPNDNYFNFNPQNVYWGPEKEVEVRGWTPPSTSSTQSSWKYRAGSTSPAADRFISSRP